MKFVIIVSNLIRMMSIFLLTYFILIKIIDYKNNDTRKSIYIILCSIINSLLYIIFSQYIQPSNAVIILSIIYAIVIHIMIIKDKFNYLAYVIAIGIAYVIFLIAVLISGALLRLCLPNIDFMNAISILIIPCVEFFIVKLTFRIKRFNKGFNFLKNKTINKDTTNFTILFSLIIVMFFRLMQESNEIAVNKRLMALFVIISISLSIWIKSQITKTYKNRMRDRTIEIQKTEIDEQTKTIEEIKAENIKLATAIHKYNKKFSSLEFAMKKALELESKTEFANEISTILEEYQEASKNFAKEVEVNKTKLPETKVVGIDNMFKYMQEEANNKNINLDLKLNTNIKPLIEKIISKDKFETLIGDHLKDAIIAVDASPNAYKSILATLGLVNGIYEFSVYDTGIEFEIDTLLKLGKEQITTHKDEGGSGIGFMTTFETLKECKASLIIEEYNPEVTNYTKAVIIRFYGKCEYKICSYRAEKIKEQKHECRIIIEKLK